MKMKKKAINVPCTVIRMDLPSSTSTPHVLLWKNHLKSQKTIRKKKIIRNFKTSSKINNKSTFHITAIQHVLPNQNSKKNFQIDELFEDQSDKSHENEENGIITKIPNHYLDNNHASSNGSSICNNDESVLLSNEEINIPRFYSLKNKVICVMEPECSFSFCGKLTITVLYGAVKIYGAILQQLNTTTPKEIYSPKGMSLVEVQAISMTLGKNVKHLSNHDIWRILEKSNIDNLNSLKNYLHALKNNYTLVVLENFSNNLTHFIDKYFPYKLFPIIQEDFSNYSWTDFKRAKIVLQADIYSDHTKIQSSTINTKPLDDVIEKIVNDWRMNKSAKVLIAGGKNVGKSTNMRVLVNSLIERECKQVIVVDLDPGQSEFTPPGCISLNIVDSFLLGPNFTHFQKPYYQLYIGDVDVTRCLANYIQGIEKLINYLNQFLSSTPYRMPIVVNTMGFCKNIGWNIICSIIKWIKPTDIIQIRSKVSKNNFDQLLNYNIVYNQLNIWRTQNVVDSLDEYKLYIIDSLTETENNCRAVGDIWKMEPYQQRDVATLAYFSKMIKLKSFARTWKDNNTYTSSNINSIIPYQINFDSIKMSLGFPVTSQLLSVINGSIVALCGVDNNKDKQREMGNQNLSRYPHILIKPPLSTCYGCGIVRGIDIDKKLICINTPITLFELRYVNCLIGCTPLPSRFLQLKPHKVPYVSGDYNLPTGRDPRRGYFRIRVLEGT